MRRPNYIGYNPNKMRDQSTIQQSHDYYKDKTMLYNSYRDRSDNSQDVLPTFDRTSLVAYWPFIDNLNDYGPNGFHWTLSTVGIQGGHKPLFLPAMRNKALYFENNWWTIPTNAAWRFGTGNFTLMFWHHVNDVEAWSTSAGSPTHGLINMRTNDADTGWEFYSNGGIKGKMTFRMQNLDLSSATNVSSNKWEHWAIVRYGTGANQTYMWRDGVFESYRAYATNMQSTAYLCLGRSQTYGQYNRNSSIQHFMAFSTALDQKQISLIINQTSDKNIDTSEM